MNMRLYFGLGLVLALLVLIYSGVADALIYFVMIGAIPSTHYSLSPSVMLTIMLLIAWVCVVRYAQNYHPNQRSGNVRKD